jgi:hypothetical protein
MNNKRKRKKNKILGLLEAPERERNLRSMLSEPKSVGTSIRNLGGGDTIHKERKGPQMGRYMGEIKPASRWVPVREMGYNPALLSSPLNPITLDFYHVSLVCSSPPDEMPMAVR